MRTRRKAEDDSAEPCPEILADLTAVLAAGRAVYLTLGPEGAVLSLKAPELFAFGESIGMKWRWMKPEERARAVLGWIHKAAAYSRKPKVRWAPA